MTLYSDLVAAGCEIDNHYSDLYVKVTGVAAEILREHDARFSVFKSQIDGELWYDVPFAYKPFWDAVRAKLPLAAPEDC